jgi:hypothetical protein
MTSIKDKFWIWGHPANSHYVYNKWCSDIKPSRMTPAESAFYFDVPNLLMVRYKNQPKPPFDQEFIPLKPLSQVVWSLLPAIDLKTGHSEAGGTDLDAVLDLAQNNENLTGVVLDDFFGRDDKDGALEIEELQAIQKKLTLKNNKLDLWVVCYDRLCGKTPPDEVITPYLKCCDVISYWTWNGADLVHLEENFKHIRQLADKCDCRLVLGCYMFDYGEKKLLPVELMEKQCQLGLNWLNEDSIDGMIFLASCISDLDLEAVKWTQNWIKELE